MITVIDEIVDFGIFFFDDFREGSHRFQRAHVKLDGFDVSSLEAALPEILEERFPKFDFPASCGIAIAIKHSKPSAALPMTTCMSHCINILTTSRPMPRLPPVITATLPDFSGRSAKGRSVHRAQCFNRSGCYQSCSFPSSGSPRARPWTPSRCTAARIWPRPGCG